MNQRKGKRGTVITQIKGPSGGGESRLSIEIDPDKLKSALWEPDVDPDPESPEPWGGWMWFFTLDDGTEVAVTNDRRGGNRWSVWVDNTKLHQDAAEKALLDVLRTAGYRPRVIYH